MWWFLLCQIGRDRRNLQSETGQFESRTKVFDARVHQTVQEMPLPADLSE